MFDAAVPVVVQWKRMQLGTMRLQVQSLASLTELRIWHCHELWCRSQNSAQIWHCCGCGRLVAKAPTGPLAWEPPYAAGAA